MSATLHHQIICHLQNHSIYFPLTRRSSNSLLVVTNREEDLFFIVQIPRRITREELTRLIPLEWIISYEKIHQDRRQIQSKEATFRISIDKIVKIIFKNKRRRTEFSFSNFPNHEDLAISKIILVSGSCCY